MRSGGATLCRWWTVSPRRRSGRSRTAGAGGWDRFDAEAAMQTSVVETAVVREIEDAGGCA